LGVEEIMSERIQTFREFWPYYLGEHAVPSCRALHFVGTTAAFGCVISAIVAMNPWFILGGLLCGYGPAWIAHFFIEKNRPATFKYPLWSMIADFRMWGNMVLGRFWSDAPILQQAGVNSGESVS